GHNVLTALLRLSHDELRERIAVYRDARSQAGYSPQSGMATLMLHTFVGPDMDYVEAQVKEVLKEYLRSHMEHTEAVSQEKEGQNTTRLTASEEEELLEHAYQRYLQESSLIGTVETCQRTIEKLVAIGVDEVACLVDFGINGQAMQVGLEHLAKLQQACRDQLLT
ncbi:MAG: LLM class flavin-dependent oxidoreductase, partial [Cyanothece sp. SIO1E1]|nr:LLM class flavin-dependent oxidoreductase [Cyanothece sp. SIO1E1]